MSEQKLTVAELMARAAKEGHGDAPRRRHRRRSIEEGGITVAELTGSFPKVEVTPEEPRHTSRPLEKENADPATAVPVAAASDVEVSPSAPQPNADTSADDKDAAAAERLRRAKAAQAAARLEIQQQPSDQPAPAPTKKPAATFDDPAASESGPAAAPTMVLDVVDEKDPPKLTTGEFPAVTRDMPAVTPASRPKQPQPAAAAPSADAEPEAEGTSSASAVAVTIAVIIGLVIGVALFKGFELLWASISPFIPLVLGILVTLGIIGGVHALRTEKRGAAMVLAGLAGIVITFGPLIVTGWPF